MFIKFLEKLKRHNCELLNFLHGSKYPIIRRVKLALVILTHDVWNNRMGKNPMVINN